MYMPTLEYSDIEHNYYATHRVNAYTLLIGNKYPYLLQLSLTHTS